MNEWWRGAVIYQIYPRSFQDSNGDGVGDLPGITARLDHVASLGVDAIWLSPVFPSPMADMGYDVSDYTGIAPMFGTLADFDALIARAHALGLRVILDQVFNHSSDQHPWFIDSRTARTGPRADWYVWADPRPNGAPPNNWLSVFGGPAWTWDARRRQYYLHHFLPSQPDLNFHCEEVQEAALSAMRFWLERGVDGFRLDTVNYYVHGAGLRDNPPALPKGAWPPVNPYDMQDHVNSINQPGNLDFLARMRRLTDSFDARMMVGEVGDPQHALRLMADYTRGTRHLHMAYSFELLGPEFTAAHFRSRIEGFFTAAPDGWPCWSFSNHDVMRHVSRWAKHGVTPEALARQAIALLAALPGTLCLYQGEELGQTDTELSYDELTDPVGLAFWPDNKGRDGARTPMVWDAKAPQGGFTTGTPWLPVKPAQLARAVSAQGRDGPLAFYRDMLTFRRATPALGGPAPARFHDLPEPVLAFWRMGPQPLLCVYNLSPKARDLMLSAAAVLTGPAHATLKGATLALPANGFAFLTPASGKAGEGKAGKADWPTLRLA